MLKHPVPKQITYIIRDQAHQHYDIPSEHSMPDRNILMAALQNVNFNNKNLYVEFKPQQIDEVAMEMCYRRDSDVLNSLLKVLILNEKEDPKSIIPFLTYKDAHGRVILDEAVSVRLSERTVIYQLIAIHDPWQLEFRKEYLLSSNKSKFEDFIATILEVVELRALTSLLNLKNEDGYNTFMLAMIHQSMNTSHLLKKISSLDSVGKEIILTQTIMDNGEDLQFVNGVPQLITVEKISILDLSLKYYPELIPDLLSTIIDINNKSKINLLANTKYLNEFVVEAIKQRALPQLLAIVPKEHSIMQVIKKKTTEKQRVVAILKIENSEIKDVLFTDYFQTYPKTFIEALTQSILQKHKLAAENLKILVSNDDTAATYCLRYYENNTIIKKTNITERNRREFLITLFEHLDNATLCNIIPDNQILLRKTLSINNEKLTKLVISYLVKQNYDEKCSIINTLSADEITRLLRQRQGLDSFLCIIANRIVLFTDEEKEKIKSNLLKNKSNYLLTLPELDKKSKIRYPATIKENHSASYINHFNPWSFIRTATTTNTATSTTTTRYSRSNYSKDFDGISDNYLLCAVENYWRTIDSILLNMRNFSLEKQKALWLYQSRYTPDNTIWGAALKHMSIIPNLLLEMSNLDIETQEAILRKITPEQKNALISYFLGVIILEDFSSGKEEFEIFIDTILKMQTSKILEFLLSLQPKTGDNVLTLTMTIFPNKMEKILTKISKQSEQTQTKLLAYQGKNGGNIFSVAAKAKDQPKIIRDLLGIILQLSHNSQSAILHKIQDLPNFIKLVIDKKALPFLLAIMIPHQQTLSEIQQAISKQTKPEEIITEILKFVDDISVKLSLFKQYFKSQPDIFIEALTASIQQKHRLAVANLKLPVDDNYTALTYCLYQFQKNNKTSTTVKKENIRQFLLALVYYVGNNEFLDILGVLAPNYRMFLQAALVLNDTVLIKIALNTINNLSIDPKSEVIATLSNKNKIKLLHYQNVLSSFPELTIMLMLHEPFLNEIKAEAYAEEHGDSDINQIARRLNKDWKNIKNHIFDITDNDDENILMRAIDTKDTKIINLLLAVIKLQNKKLIEKLLIHTDKKNRSIFDYALWRCGEEFTAICDLLATYAPKVMRLNVENYFGNLHDVQNEYIRQLFKSNNPNKIAALLKLTNKYGNNILMLLIANNPVIVDSLLNVISKKITMSDLAIILKQKTNSKVKEIDGNGKTYVTSLDVINILDIAAEYSSIHISKLLKIIAMLPKQEQKTIFNNINDVTKFIDETNAQNALSQLLEIISPLQSNNKSDKLSIMKLLIKAFVALPEENKLPSESAALLVKHSFRAKLPRVTDTNPQASGLPVGQVSEKKKEALEKRNEQLFSL